MGSKFFLGQCDLLRFSFAFTLTVLILFSSIDFSNASCQLIGYGSSAEDVECPAGFEQAYYEVTSSGFMGMCCNQRDSLQYQRRSIEGCRTTSCVPSRGALPCSTLNPVYIDGEEMIKDYEHTINETCTNPDTEMRGRASVCCPRNSYDALHVSASSAERNEFPHMASMGSCGATVYNSDWLITAAHCVVDDNGRVRNLRRSPLTVTVGTNLGEISSSRNIFPVERIEVHQNYSLKAGHNETRRVYQRIYNDIALLKLGRSIDFSMGRNIRSLEIAPANFQPELYADQVVIAGWGTSELIITSQHLQKSNLLFRDDDTCFNKRRGKLGRNQYDVLEFGDQLLCIGGIVNNSVSNEAGRGDSGGPAICRGEDGYAVHCGVTSFGSEYPEEVCVTQRNEAYCKPSVYADVGFFHDWIVGIAGDQDSSSFHKAILYGKEVDEGEYSHQVHVRTDDGHKCGGTLVSEDTVVTSAHCVFSNANMERPGIKVDAFIRDITETPENTIRAKSVIHAPNFGRYTNIDSLNNTRSKRMMIRDPPYSDNIAVIKLRKKVGISKKDLAKLPKSSKFRAGRAVELAFPLNTARSGALMQRNFTVLSKDDCRKRLVRFRAIDMDITFDTEKVMCGVEKYSGGSICDRELGGALMCKGNTMKDDEFCGVQTFRMCETTLPSAFLFTGKYLDMIRKVIEQK